MKESLWWPEDAIKQLRGFVLRDFSELEELEISMDLKGLVAAVTLFDEEGLEATSSGALLL